MAEQINYSELVCKAGEDMRQAEVRQQQQAAQERALDRSARIAQYAADFGINHAFAAYLVDREDSVGTSLSRIRRVTDMHTPIGLLGVD